MPYLTRSLGILAAFTCFQAAAYDPQDKVITIPGSMPIIFSVPHDGGEALGWMSTRSKGTTVRDSATRELAERTSELLEQRTGTRPYLVIAKFSRKFLDVNRKESEALESEDAIPAYRHYHDTLTAYTKEVVQKYAGRALLIDIHGQSDEPEITFRGSRNGATAKRLIKEFGPASLQGEHSITGLLQGKGYQVFPPVDAVPGEKEDKRFNGGYVIFAHGSNTPDGVDAIQLEFGKRVRDKDELASDFADAIIGFQKKFLNAPTP